MPKKEVAFVYGTFAKGRTDQFGFRSPGTFGAVLRFHAGVLRCNT